MGFTVFKRVGHTLVQFQNNTYLELTMVLLELIGTQNRWNRYLPKQMIPFQRQAGHSCLANTLLPLPSLLCILVLSSKYSNT